MMARGNARQNGCLAWLNGMKEVAEKAGFRFASDFYGKSIASSFKTPVRQSNTLILTLPRSDSAARILNEAPVSPDL